MGTNNLNQILSLTRVIKYIVFVLLLSSCVNKTEVWRNLETDSPTLSIFVGSIQSAKHISRPWPEKVCPDPSEPSPDGKEVICVSGYLDPPPIKLTIDVEQQIYGPELGTKVFANTTSHFGLHSFNIKDGQKYLMLVLSDGITNIIPKYHFEPVVERDLEGLVGASKLDSYVLPIEELNDEVYWLPCDSQVREKVISQESKVGLYFFYNTVKEEPDYDDELFYRKATMKQLIEEHKVLISQDSRYHFKGQTLYVSTYALLIEELKENLENYTQEQMLIEYEQDGACINE